MKAKDLMTSKPACCTPDDTARDAARMMREHDCGCLPVVEDQKTKKVIGTVTDRDITCRCTAEGKSADTPVREIMSSSPSCCGPDDDLRAVERVMEEQKVRRVPIVDEKGCCVGIVAQADLARAREARSDLAEVVERVSEPPR